MKVMLLVGLPGSGKTYLGKKIMADNLHSIFWDDISQKQEGELASRFDRFVNLITQPIFYGHMTVVIADINLCEAESRAKAIETIKHYNPDVELEWVFFENAPDKCRKNVIHRNDGRNVDGSILRFSKTYTIPEGVTPLKIWQET